MLRLYGFPVSGDKMRTLCPLVGNSETKQFDYLEALGLDNI